MDSVGAIQSSGPVGGDESAVAAAADASEARLATGASDASAPVLAAMPALPDTPEARGALGGLAAAYPVQFTGEGAQYLRIWIVNLVLSVLTLGIYSPWAKVRRLKYFYGNTLVDGSPFEFHGSPIALLKGRVIAVVLLLAYTQAGKISFTLWLGVVAVLVIIFPWLIWKSLRFRLANSSYRGIRFGFEGTLRGVYAAFAPPMLVLAALSGASYALQSAAVPASVTGAPKAPVAALLFGPALALLVLMACAPWFWIRIKRYQHDYARLGEAPFAFRATLGEAYGLGLIGLGLSLVFFLAGSLSAIALFALAAWLLGVVNGARDLVSSAAAITLGGVGFYLVFLGIYPFMYALAQNLVWGKTSVAGQAFRSTARGWPLWWIGAGNLLLLIATLGLYWPFAVIRTMRYRLQAVAWAGDPAALVARAADSQVGASGDESVDLLGFDLAL
jgi:uncharacterized membrane protein YjgN (DUF898 family)